MITLHDVLILTFQEHLLNVCNTFCWVKILGANGCTVEDGLTLVKLEFIIKCSQTFLGLAITGVRNPTISLQQDCWAEITAVTVPPVGWATILGGEKKSWVGKGGCGDEYMSGLW